MKPAPLKIDLPNQAGTVEITTTVTQGMLVILQKAVLRPALISAADYDQLIELNKKLTQPAAQTVLFKKRTL
jgi:hypothetical protein